MWRLRSFHKAPKLKRMRKTTNPAPLVEERMEQVIHVVHRLQEAKEME